MLGAWFLCVGLLPRSLSLKAAVWRMAPAQRPWLVSRLLQLIRGEQRHAPKVA
jgi:hypothetical protein